MFAYVLFFLVLLFLHIAKNLSSNANDVINNKNEPRQQNIDVSSNISNNINNISINNSLILDERHYNYQDNSSGEINNKNNKTLDILKQIIKSVTMVMKSTNQLSKNMFNETKMLKLMIEKLNCYPHLNPNINNYNSINSMNRSQRKQQHSNPLRRRSYPRSEAESTAYGLGQSSLISTVVGADYTQTLDTIHSLENSRDHGPGTEAGARNGSGAGTTTPGAAASSNWHRTTPRVLPRSVNSDYMSSTVTSSNYTASSRMTGLGRDRTRNNHTNDFVNNRQQSSKFGVAHAQM